MESQDGKLLEDRLRGTARVLHDFVSTLSDEERSKIPELGGWSAVECVEHIALVADGFSMRIVSSPVGDPSPSNPKREAELDRLVRSRETRIAAPHRVQPRKSFSSSDEALAEFDRVNTAVLLRLEQVEGRLRSLQVQHPALGQLSGYEAFLMIDAHTHRHMKQIEELIGREVAQYAQ